MQFSKEIKEWYRQNKRDLPWRNTQNPYFIWLSEVILQQTRVSQGMKYYLNFVERFPTIEDLANAKQEDVLKLWQGLGYYSRARNLHFAAQQVMTDFDGMFPESYTDIKRLKGIGDYTAAAIASFSHNEPKAVVDGNVYRVLSRYFGIETPIDTTQGKKEFADIAQELLDEKYPGLHNQAIMEFGALQCIPKNPNCGVCPLQSTCSGFKSEKIDDLPIKSKKIKQRDRFFNYLVIHAGTDTFMKQRQSKDIWQGLYEFPLIETNQQRSIKELISSEDWNTLIGNASVKIRIVHPEVKHILSHQILYTRFIEIDIDKPYSLSNYDRFPLSEIEKFAVPILIGNFIKNFIVDNVV